MTRLTFEELQLLNENRRLAKEHKKRSITREKLQEGVEKWLKQQGNKITEVPSQSVPRPLRTIDVFDHEYCGKAKTDLVLAWLNQGDRFNGRRTRLADKTGIPIQRIYNLTCASNGVRLSNREYKLIQKAKSEIEAIEKETMV